MQRKLKNYPERIIIMEYEKERDANFMIILLLISVILALWFGSSLRAFENFGAAFFIAMLIAVWLVSMNAGKFIKKSRKGN
ncbi:MAG: hypothetical protein V3U72_01515 [Candidatus Aenigmarchaeota archaeon]